VGDLLKNDTMAEEKTKWVAIASTGISFVVGVVFAAYVLGQRTGKVLDLTEWKSETAPRIERMDGQGTLSFKLFHEEYLRTQERQERKLDDLDRRVRELERK
jgi:hypothetical protein